jgi:hypothetical protein
VVGGGVVDDAVQQQRPILHQSQHGVPSDVVVRSPAFEPV